MTVPSVFGSMRPRASSKPRVNYMELGYVVVNLQDEGHAIITACERVKRRLAPGIARIHGDMPERADSNRPYRANEDLKRRLSSMIREPERTRDQGIALQRLADH